MRAYRYQLDDSAKKYSCPVCEKKRFVRFVDQKTRHYLPIEFGRCDREVSCSYFLSPYGDHRFTDSEVNYNPPEKPKPKLIPSLHFHNSLGNYYRNNFVQYLLSLFNHKTVKKLINTYQLGTSNKLRGGCIFYQIDLEGRARRGKIIVYNPETGRRGRIHSVHSLLKIDKKYYPSWRFFGEHLLIDKTKPIAIVEAEKTAVISSAFFPEFIWLAVGNKSTLKVKYAQVLKGRFVTLFPDIGAYEDWKARLGEFSAICSISISKLLEDKSDEHEKTKGLDLADYLTQSDLAEFY